jgi:glutamine amidotransferase
MCRHLGYIGPATPVSTLLLDPEHSLLRQSWAPADMRHGGTINADGFGVGWYTTSEPVVYRRSIPVWTDAALPALLTPVRATTVLAAVRSATVGMPVVETAAAPFTDGRWLFSHNGVVRGWPESVAPLAARLPVTDLMTLDAPTDAALLWALVRARLHAGEAPEKALADVVVAVEAHAPNSRLNLMVTDGLSLTATAWTHSLSTLVTDTSVVIASEPYDSDPRWTPVPDRHLVAARLTAGAPSLAVHPLGTTNKGSQ